MHRGVEHRKWTVRADSVETAMDAMEAEMARLGHTVITHESVEAIDSAGRWRVRSLIRLGGAKREKAQR